MDVDLPGLKSRGEDLLEFPHLKFCGLQSDDKTVPMLSVILSLGAELGDFIGLGLELVAHLHRPVLVFAHRQASIGLKIHTSSGVPSGVELPSCRTLETPGTPPIFAE